MNHRIKAETENLAYQNYSSSFHSKIQTMTFHFICFHNPERKMPWTPRKLNFIISLILSDIMYFCHTKNVMAYSAGAAEYISAEG